MKRIISVIFVFLVTSLFSPVISKEFSFEKEAQKMIDLMNQKAYKKVLDKGLKLKKHDLTEEQSEFVKVFMENAYYKKKFDTALKNFTVTFDQYDNYYLYTPNVYFYDEVTPTIFVTADGKEIKILLKFKAEHFSRTRLSPNRIVLHSDGENIELVPHYSSDNIISRDTYKRRCIAKTTLSSVQIYEVAKALKGKDVSFKISSPQGNITQAVFEPTKAFYENALIVYTLLTKKQIKPGQARF